MCEIQLIKKLDGKSLTIEDKNMFVDMLRLGSTYNSHAYGLFYPKGIVFKSEGITDVDKITDILDDVRTDLLVGHNRYQTKGDSKFNYNNHPFETNNFLVVHNGVLRNDEALKTHWNLTYEPLVDSYIIPALLEKFLSEVKTELNVVNQVIIPTLQELYGSYSVVILYKPDNTLFYAKSSSTKFTFALTKIDGKEYIFGSTDKENISIQLMENKRGLFTQYKPALYYEPKAESVYQITDEKIFRVGTFKEASYEKMYYKSQYNENKETKSDWVRGLGFCRQEHQARLALTFEQDTIRNKLKFVARQVEDLLKAENTDGIIRVVNRKYNDKAMEVQLEYKGKSDSEHTDISTVLQEDIQDTLSQYASVHFILDKEYSEDGKFKGTMYIDLFDEDTKLDKEDVKSEDTELEELLIEGQIATDSEGNTYTMIGGQVINCKDITDRDELVFE